MIVAELIEELKKHDPSRPVVLRSYASDGGLEEVTGVHRLEGCYIGGTYPAVTVIILED